MPEHYEIIHALTFRQVDMLTLINMGGRMTQWKTGERCIQLPSSISMLQFSDFDISFSPSSSSSSIHAYGRLCGRNFNLKHMRGNPTLCCSLMGHHGIGVCREWLNFVRRPGTIKSRLPLCNRPFPSHNVTSGKTWRSRRGAKGWKPQSLDQTTEKCFFSSKWLTTIYNKKET